MEMKKVNSWLFEEITPDFYQIFGIEKMLFSGRTRYQKVEIFENQTFGKCLVLDGSIPFISFLPSKKERMGCWSSAVL